MRLAIPCGRPTSLGTGGKPNFSCNDDHLCAHCAAIRILLATCKYAEITASEAWAQIDEDDGPATHLLNELIGRLRADVARVMGEETHR